MTEAVKPVGTVAAGTILTNDNRCNKHQIPPQCLSARGFLLSDEQKQVTLPV